MHGVTWLKVIFFGTVAAMLFSLLSLTIDKLVRPERGLLFLDLTYVVYVLVLLIAAVSGAAVSLAALISRSKNVSLMAALLVAITISTGLIRGAYATYSSAIFFDAPMFYADLVQIVLNLIIYPLVALLIWKVFGKELAAQS